MPSSTATGYAGATCSVSSDTEPVFIFAYGITDNVSAELDLGVPYKHKLYGAGANVRDWIHVDDHNDAVIAILEQGRLGETYLIGADGEQDNASIVALLLELLGKPGDWFDHVNDRPGHDLRYAIDSGKLRAETDWRPRYQDIRAGLTQTIQWYREHEAWWAPAKERTEQAYQRLGR